MIEDETTEFKAEYSDGIVKSAVAFLNTRGGVIYVGIADDGTVCGVDDPDGLTRKIVQELTDKELKEIASSFVKDAPTRALQNVLTSEANLRKLALNRDLQGRIDHYFKYRVNVKGRVTVPGVATL